MTRRLSHWTALPVRQWWLNWTTVWWQGKGAGEMKRYALFVGSRYYPSGGWRDLVGSFDSVDEARDAAWPRRRHETMGWYHIADTEQGRIVETGELGEEETV